MRDRFRSWLDRLREDVKMSADPGLLTGLRVLGLLYGRIDRRLPISKALEKAWSRRLPPNVSWQHAFGGIAYFLFMILVVSGVLLAFYYRPSVEEAYPSMQFIVSDAPFGWLVRDMHVWAANLIVLALLAHMARVLFAGAYKPPRETNWFVGVALLAVVVVFGVTGYLLPWDQWAYWATTAFTTGVEDIPLIGGALAMFLRGDRIVSSATLSRFFALHVVVLPWVAFGLISLHYIVLRGQGIAGSEGARPDEGTPFYPQHLLRIVIVSVSILAVVGTLAAFFPRPMGEPANPFHLPEELVSTWILVDVTKALFLYVGTLGALIAFLLVVVVVFIPLFDRGTETDLRKRPFVAVLGALLFGGLIVAWVVGHRASISTSDIDMPQELIEERAIPPISTPVSEEPPTNPQTGGEEAEG